MQKRGEPNLNPGFFGLHFHTALIEDLYTSHSRGGVQVKKTMNRAGYLCRDGHEVLDNEGIPREVIYFFIHGARLCIPVEEITGVIGRGTTGVIRRIKQNWMEYLGGEAGTVSVSRSGKALNILLVNGDRFTLSLESLRNVLSFKERIAPIMELHAVNGKRHLNNHILTDFSGPLSPCTA